MLFKGPVCKIYGYVYFHYCIIVCAGTWTLLIYRERLTKSQIVLWWRHDPSYQSWDQVKIKTSKKVADTITTLRPTLPLVGWYTLTLINLTPCQLRLQCTNRKLKAVSDRCAVWKRDILRLKTERTNTESYWRIFSLHCISPSTHRLQFNILSEPEVISYYQSVTPVVQFIILTSSYSAFENEIKSSPFTSDWDRVWNTD